MVERTSLPRAVLLVVVAAIVEAIVGPYLSFGGIAPRLTLIAVVIAAFGLQELQGILLGFFGGILIDALGEGLFGVGAFGGLVAGALAVRFARVQIKGVQRLLLAQAVALSIAAYDVIHLVATDLAGMNGPSFLGFLVGGVVPDAVVNGALAYVFGMWFLRRIQVRRPGWT
jgi:rod shape-determining protein MreD